MTADLRAGIGDALSTDYFLLREEFSPAQLQHLLTTRAFVQEEVLPVINDYWEGGLRASTTTGRGPSSPGPWARSWAGPAWSATASRGTAARPWTRCPPG